MGKAANIFRFPSKMRGLSDGRGYPSPTDPVQYNQYPLPEGDKGTAQTIERMMALAMGNEGAENPHIREAALRIVSQCASKDSACERQMVLEWVKANIAFRNEYGEVIQSPMVTLYDFQAGDCDDHSTLIAALLMSLGHTVQFSTVATNGAQQDQHVMPMALDHETGQWITLDSTVSASYAGWFPKNVTRGTAWGAMALPATAQAGLGFLGDCPDGYYTDQDGNCQPGSGFVPAFTQITSAVAPLVQPFVNAAAYRDACNGPYGYLDPNCGYNPNQSQFYVRTPQLNTAGFGFPSGQINISPTTLLLGGAAFAVLLVALSRSKRR